MSTAIKGGGTNNTSNLSTGRTSPSARASVLLSVRTEARAEAEAEAVAVAEAPA
eukprot:CAMPEP_0173254658 /NCGR_PEP_ID=MMETSP1142-20121109/22054_1 /TAXON_ID=483371 /ORGANISM="non described non described, Strain CCMP2298" /LENGTH=53 /DNA_ID=CAMNT_0014188135 /DNA_START=271 /DNA_END=428 /DNA_ORIENTATION=-